uniref:Reverse transcriptase domain-containing protein n=1 Tax=Graphocephala atropunctata TaxID=36148 RepID=A0A1B6MJK2_9HEMI
MMTKSGFVVSRRAFIKIKIGKITTFIIGVYRTNRNLIQGLEIIAQILQKIQAEKHRVIFMGDINIDSLVKKHDYTLMQDILKSHDMERLDLPPTRITPTSRTSIDCVCTNLPQEELDVHVINTGISDHTGQLCTLKLNSTKHQAPSTMERRHMNNRNLYKLKTCLGQQDWTEVYSSEEVNDAYNRFLHILTDVMNETCPMVKSRTMPKPSKLMLNDPTTIHLKGMLVKAQDEYNATGSEEHKRNASAIKKEYDLRLRLLRQQATKNAVAEADNKTKALWRVINSERKPKEKINLPTELDIQGTLSSDPIKMADYMNNFFVNIADDTIHNNGQTTGQAMLLPVDNPDIPVLDLYQTTRQEVSRVMDSLKPKTSSGYDGISAKLLKTCKEELIDPIVDIVNKSFLSGNFPSALKMAKVYPLFKQGSPTQASNYRPISLVPTFSKIIEKLTLTRLIDHVTTNELLTTQQHGFLKGKSTTTALICLVEFLIDQLEDGNTTTAILLDYSKAFDCLSHEHLMAKLSAIGVTGTAYNWFHSYLTGRCQMVELMHNSKGIMQQIKSEPKSITRGVPQGSVLGPVLFILFTNDFPRYLKDYCRSLMYADDTVLLLGNNNPKHLEVTSYIALNMGIQYCHRNDLVVNETKTKQLILGKHREAVGKLPDLEEVTVAKYLGVTIDESLSWTPHIDLLCNKLSVSLFVIRRIKNICDVDTAKIAYYSLFETHLRYGIEVWGATTRGNLERVLLLQKRAIRILGDLQSRETCRSKYKDLKLLTVVNLYILEVVTYSHLKSLNPIRTAAQVHDYSTRHAANYSLPTHHCTMTEKKPSYAGARMWNVLPPELKTASTQQFRHLLKNWLLDHPFYSITEFYGWRQSQEF